MPNFCHNVFFSFFFKNPLGQILLKLLAFLTIHAPRIYWPPVHIDKNIEKSRCKVSYPNTTFFFL